MSVDFVIGKLLGQHFGISWTMYASGSEGISMSSSKIGKQGASM